MGVKHLLPVFKIPYLHFEIWSKMKLNLTKKLFLRNIEIWSKNYFDKFRNLVKNRLLGKYQNQIWSKINYWANIKIKFSQKSIIGQISKSNLVKKYFLTKFRNLVKNQIWSIIFFFKFGNLVKNQFLAKDRNFGQKWKF